MKWTLGLTQPQKLPHEGRIAQNHIRRPRIPYPTDVGLHWLLQNFCMIVYQQLKKIHPRSHFMSAKTCALFYSYLCNHISIHTWCIDHPYKCRLLSYSTYDFLLKYSYTRNQLHIDFLKIDQKSLTFGWKDDTNFCTKLFNFCKFCTQRFPKKESK